MDLTKRFELIKRNTVEIITEDELKKLLSLKKKPVVYLGTAITGRPHIGYFVWVLKLADFLKAGFKVKLLLADVHGALDGTPWNVLEKRFDYYKKVITTMFECVGADIKDIEVVKGSDFQMKKEYIYDLMKLSTHTTVHDATKAAAEVVKMGDNPKLSGILYPLMQALDEEYLEADVQYGGLDQRKILVFARENLPKIGYKSRIEIMTPIIPGLVGKKMSASDPKTKVDILDDEQIVTDKIKNAFCEAGVVEDNGVLAFLKNVIMVIKQDNKESFVIERPAKFGGNISFKTYAELEDAFVEKKVHPLDLKAALAKDINILLHPARKQSKILQKLAQDAYP
jgi:tyrosyl-tRNA synthetase